MRVINAGRYLWECTEESLGEAEENAVLDTGSYSLNNAEM